MRPLEPLTTYSWQTKRPYGNLVKRAGNVFALYGVGHNLDEARAIRDWLNKFIEDCELGV